MKFLLSICLALAIFMAGCTSIQNSDAGAKLAVMVAVSEFIKADDTETRTDRARKVAEVAKDAQLLFDTKTMSIGVIEVSIREKIHWSSLEPIDAIVVDALITMIALEIKDRIDDGAINKDVSVTASRVLIWVEDAASLYFR